MVDKFGKIPPKFIDATISKNNSGTEYGGPVFHSIDKKLTSENEYFMLNTDDSTYSYYKRNDNPYCSLPSRNRHHYENIVLDRPKINSSKLSCENMPTKSKVTPTGYTKQNYGTENSKEGRSQDLYDYSHVTCARNMSPHHDSSSAHKTLPTPNIAT